MRTKVMRIRINSETENQIKGRAGSEGKSMAETIRSMIEKSLNSSSESGLENRSGSGTGLDPDSHKNLIETVRESALKNIPSAADSIALARGIESVLNKMNVLRAEIQNEKRGDLQGMAGHKSFLSTPLIRKGVVVAGMTGLFLGMAIFAGGGWFLFQKGEENGIARSTSMMLTIDSLLKCEAPGWKIQTTIEGRVCYPYSAKDGLHGWKLP